MREIVSQSDINRIDAELFHAQEAGVAEGDTAAGQGVDADVAAGQTAKIAAGEDKYTARLIKYIPAEVVALYITLKSILEASNQSGSTVLQWLIFIFCLGGTYVYLRRVAHVSKQTQLILSTLAFVVWAYSMKGPFGNLYDPLFGALLLPMFTFTIPLIEP